MTLRALPFALAASALALSPSIPVIAQNAVATEAPDVAPWQAERPARPPLYPQVEKRSVYIAMPDGTRLAVDYYLPQGVRAGARLPTILQQTRYYRSIAHLDDPAGSCRKIPAMPEYFATRGYAFVVVDVRGTGASFGTRDNELSAREVADGARVLDWIAAQPWSDGRVGATGTSYVGTSAELLAGTRHPALKAVAPISAGYDFYADLDFPGGVRNRFFVDNWGALNTALDTGQARMIPGLSTVAGPCPVDGDADGALLAQAQREHAGNVNSTRALDGVEFRDDARLAWPSPYLHRADIDARHIPFLTFASWTDSGYARSAINRLLGTRNPQQRLLITAGNHGLGYYYAPGVVAPVKSNFDLKAELLAFFDQYVARIANGYAREPRVRWYETGANAWRSADRWPTGAAAMRFCLAPDQLRREGQCGARRTVEHVPAADTATGGLTRWNTTMGMPVGYPERSAADAKLLTFTSAPLASAIDVTGSPVLTLNIANAAPDAAYFVYLEEVGPDGSAYYLTEGILRASHAHYGAQPYPTLVPMPTHLRADARANTAGRTLSLRIGMLPLAHRFTRGTRIRVVVAGSDSGHFAAPPLAGQQWTVTLGKGGSALTLPTPPIMAGGRARH